MWTFYKSQTLYVARTIYKNLPVRLCSFDASSPAFSKLIYSGVQPTGRIHLGNYLGAVRHWIDLQNDGRSIFSIVDMHAITVRQNPEDLRRGVYELVATLIGCGLDPTRCLLYVQSDLHEHSELCWILGTLTSHNKLRHQPQFKSKAASEEEEPHQLGLLIYPVLQAADILLFKATHVPVGADQISHVNLTNDIKDSFNNAFAPGFFSHVTPLIGDFPKLKSLTQPNKKMSKSENDDMSRIHLIDTPDSIREKIKKAVTDSTRANSYEPELRPGVSNLIDLYAIFSGLKRDVAIRACEEMNGKVLLKEATSESVIEHLAPIRKRTLNLLENKDYLDDVLDDGALRAREIAARTLCDVKKIIGFRTR